MRRLLAAVALCALAGPATAQLVGLSGRLGGGLGEVLQTPGRLTSDLRRPFDPDTLLSLRLERLDAMIRAHPRELDRDFQGAVVVRDEVLAVAPTDKALANARKAGFEIKRQDENGGVALVVLATPSGVGVREGVKRLRRLDPEGVYDFNHLYGQSGEVRPLAMGTPLPPKAAGYDGIRVGLIDSGVDAALPVFANARIEQRAFVGSMKPAPHGTAVASLIVGEAPPFMGAAPRSQLYAADVYGGAPAGGAADAIVRAIGWLTSKQVKVVNISLVGPPNAVLAAAVKLAQAKGVILVAAVGNDGPAAPPAYPASYPGVVAVTGVDGQGRVLLEAGHADHLDFAAPGADMAAAGKGGGYVTVRGTSFASPLAAARLAVLLERGGSVDEAEAALAREGRPGRGYGRALVAEAFRTPPARVRATSELHPD